MHDSQGALASYQKSLAIWEKLLGRNHLRVSDLYFTIGQLHFRSDDQSQALQMFQECLAIRETVLGVEHLYASTEVICKITKLHTERHEYRQAREVFQKALNAALPYLYSAMQPETMLEHEDQMRPHLSESGILDIRLLAASSEIKDTQSLWR
jgi:tetratricopeptide (TPR) repeat protein